MPTVLATVQNSLESSYVVTDLGMYLPFSQTASTATTIITSTTTNAARPFHWYRVQTTATTNLVLPYQVGTSTTATTYFNRTGTWTAFHTNVGGSNHVPSVMYKARPPAKTVRNSIKRALKLISNFGFEEDARIFLKGDSIEVSHAESDFKFVLTKSGSLINRTQYPGRSSPFKTELYTKSDVLVASLCVYLQDTPVLDQMLALAMFIKTGDEEMILRKANFYGVTRDVELKNRLVKCNPYLQPKLLR